MANSNSSALAIKIALGFAFLLTLYVVVQKHQGFSPRDEYFYYDTNSDNDEFIKGNLDRDQLLLLDKILMTEKKLRTHPLSDQQVQSIAKNDPAVIAAYERWCKCYDMIRSSTHVVYPDERV
jgi:hypothetical protein